MKEKFSFLKKKFNLNFLSYHKIQLFYLFPFISFKLLIFMFPFDLTLGYKVVNYYSFEKTEVKLVAFCAFFLIIIFFYFFLNHQKSKDSLLCSSLILILIKFFFETTLTTRLLILFTVFLFCYILNLKRDVNFLLKIFLTKALGVQNYSNFQFEWVDFWVRLPRKHVSIRMWLLKLKWILQEGFLKFYVNLTLFRLFIEQKVFIFILIYICVFIFILYFNYSFFANVLSLFLILTKFLVFPNSEDSITKMKEMLLSTGQNKKLLNFDLSLTKKNAWILTLINISNLNTPPGIPLNYYFLVSYLEYANTKFNFMNENDFKDSLYYDEIDIDFDFKEKKKKFFSIWVLLGIEKAHLEGIDFFQDFYDVYGYIAEIKITMLERARNHDVHIETYQNELGEIIKKVSTFTSSKPPKQLVISNSIIYNSHNYLHLGKTMKTPLLIYFEKQNTFKIHFSPSRIIRENDFSKIIPACNYIHFDYNPRTFPKPMRRCLNLSIEIFVKSRYPIAYEPLPAANIHYSLINFDFLSADLQIDNLEKIAVKNYAKIIALGGAWEPELKNAENSLNLTKNLTLEFTQLKKELNFNISFKELIKTFPRNLK